MKFKVSYQSEKAQANFEEVNPEAVYCFQNKAFKQAKMLDEAKKYGNGVLFVINGNIVLEEICF